VVVLDGGEKVVWWEWLKWVGWIMDGTGGVGSGW